MGIQAVKAARALGACGLFTFLLLAIYIVHARFFRVDVVFYSALFDAVLAAVICAGLLWGLRWFSVLNGFERLQLVVIWLLLGYAFAISVPTVLDRSLSFYLLEKLEQRGGSVRRSTLDDIVSGEFMQEYQVVEARLTEQIRSGTVRVGNDCVELTDTGRQIAAFSRFLRVNFLPRHRRLMDRYTAELTDPIAPEADHRPDSCRVQDAGRRDDPATAERE